MIRIHSGVHSQRHTIPGHASRVEYLPPTLPYVQGRGGTLQSEFNLRRVGLLSSIGSCVGAWVGPGVAAVVAGGRDICMRLTGTNPSG